MKYKDYDIKPLESEEAVAARQGYLDDINRLVDKLQKEGNFQSIDWQGEYPKCLGLPISEREKFRKEPDVKMTTLHFDDMGEVRRVKVRIIDDVYGEGLLFLPKCYSENSKLPFVISIHGASGTPECASSTWGESENYNCMSRRILDLGAVVYAPFILVGADPHRLQKIDYTHYIIERTLNKYGYSMRAMEVSHMMNAIDFFSNYPGIDKEKIGMVGMSWGSIVSMLTAEADPRVKRVLGSCFLESGVLASRICPRRLCVEAGVGDTLLIDSEVNQLNNTEHIKKQYVTLKKAYDDAGASDNLMYNEHLGGHEFDPDKEDKAVHWTFDGFFD